MIYLIPVTTIVMGRSGLSDDLDDENEPIEVDIDNEEGLKGKNSKE